MQLNPEMLQNFWFSKKILRLVIYFMRKIEVNVIIMQKIQYRARPQSPPNPYTLAATA
jgi:hypothetical protein